MLNHIHIKNFAIVDSLNLDLEPGMTVLTGETGAGKSIIIGAIELVLGKRANSDVVRTGAERADITVSFDLADTPEGLAWLKAHELDQDDECLLRRTISKDGRSKSYINGTPSTLALMRELGELLINIHGQHEFQTLLKPDLQRHLLDDFAKHTKLVDAVKSTFTDWQATKAEYDTLKKNAADAKSKSEFLSYQLQELNELNFTTQELSTLGQEQKQLANADELIHHSKNALDLLDDDDNSALKQLNQTVAVLQKIQNLSPQLSNAASLLNSAIIHCEEASNEVRHHLDSLELNPERLAHVESRLSKAHELSRKHHVEMLELPALQVNMQTELEQLENCDEHLEKLEKAIGKLNTTYFKAAKQLTSSRQKAAKKLSTLITDNMQTLGMPGGQFSIKLNALENEPRLNGMEKAQFLVSANPGQSLQPLNKVASGGELSRISLAVQVITAQHTETPSMVFDEVDVGIGGATADIVGKCLRDLSDNAQVICITHLAQVAAKGHQHLKVKKATRDNNTFSEITPLSEDERVKEIARMTGGVKITEQTLAHAKEMLVG